MVVLVLLFVFLLGELGVAPLGVLVLVSLQAELAETAGRVKVFESLLQNLKNLENPCASM